VIALSGWLMPRQVQAAVAGQPYWLQVVEAIILADLGFYTAHRLFHSIPWLWKFHAVHHSIEELDWLAAARVHPIDQIVTKGMSILPLFALGFAAVPIGIFAAIYFWHSILVHANVRLNFGPLRWLIASPEFHHWHHANQREAYNTNYAGQLSILDKLFGTMYMPEGQVPEKYGVNDPVPNTYLLHLIYPFKRRRPAPAAEAPTGTQSMVDA
jgi:sterol desaturase/sphingolipid hydroxylase (fatty acid hydroxylase superfamily)